jgi:hypothetical protein
MCFDCKTPTTNAVGYEGYRLCWSCYQLWEKADEEARKV